MRKLILVTVNTFELKEECYILLIICYRKSIKYKYYLIVPKDHVFISGNYQLVLKPKKLGKYQIKTTALKSIKDLNKIETAGYSQFNNY